MLKVKIGDTIYDSKDHPIMLILTDENKKHISNMPNTEYRYCSFVIEGTKENLDSILKWMNEV